MSGAARPRPSRRALRWSLFGMLIAVELVLVVPHLSFSSAAFTSLSWPLLAAAAGAEVVSLLAFSRMRRGLLRVGGTHIGARRMGVLTLASNAVSATAPAGTAVSAAYLYQQLRRAGANATVTVWTLVAGSIVSGLAFSVITVAGTLLNGNLDLPEIIGAAGLSILAGVAMVAALAYVTAHPAPLLRAAEWSGRRLPDRWAGPDGRVVHAAAERVLAQLRVIRPRPRDWSLALGLSILNWTADLACFVLCCYAVGAHGLALGAAALAYVAGLATIGITLTPGGLGSVEAGMLIGLAHGGVAGPVALAGVLAYRVIAYVFMGAVGWTAWASVRHAWRVRQARAAAQGWPVDQYGDELLSVTA